MTGGCTTASDQTHWSSSFHRIRWMWASHVTHHSSERLNLSTAFRQSLTYHLSGMWLFWIPLAWLGIQNSHMPERW